MSPCISVVMPVWNGERYLAAAVESILAQTFRDFELIVVDDGSTDATLKILKSYSDSRLQIHCLNHGGIVKALNHGLALARAEWVARQDADDISRPDRLERQWLAVQRRSDVVLCHTDVELIGEGASTIGRAHFPRTRSFVALCLCYKCPIVHSTVLFRKDAALSVGGYLPEERHAEDYALWGRMIERGHFVGLPERLLQFRVHAQSVSKQNATAQEALKTQIGVAHCERFMGLSKADASIVNSILRAPQNERRWRDWWWFVRQSAPRLRWKSVESFGWIALQTLKFCRPRSLTGTHES